VTFATGLDDLESGRLPDVALFFIHRFQAHDGRIAAVATHAAKAFGRMDIRFEIFCGLRQVFHSKRQVTSDAAVGFRGGRQYNVLENRGRAP